MIFFALAYAVAFTLVTCAYCEEGPPTITKPYMPKGKFSTNRSKDSPPYYGAVYIDNVVLTKEDPNAIKNLVRFKGQKCRTIWHQHLEEWVNIEAYIFQMMTKDKIKFYAWVDPKYGSKSKAKKIAKKVTKSLGSLPEFLRKDIHVIAILSEGGGANADTGGGVITWHEPTFKEDGGNTKKSYVEEVYTHEGAHTSIDNDIYYTDAWDNAVQADPNFISDYAKDSPDSEDVAESFGAWFALKSGRLDESDQKKITGAIPNRLALFDDLYSFENADWYPIYGKKSGKKYKTPTKKDWGGWYHC